MGTFELILAGGAVLAALSLLRGVDQSSSPNRSATPIGAPTGFSPPGAPGVVFSTEGASASQWASLSAGTAATGAKVLAGGPVGVGFAVGTKLVGVLGGQKTPLCDFPHLGKMLDCNRIAASTGTPVPGVARDHRTG